LVLFYLYRDFSDYEVKTKHYESIFLKFHKFEEYIEKTLIFSSIPDVRSLEEEKNEYKNEQENGGNNDTKWLSFISTLNFVSDLIYISEILRNVAHDLRLKMLQNLIYKINKKLPADVYLPVELVGKSRKIKQQVLRICENSMFCLNSKERVPFHILIEVEEIHEYLNDSSSSSSQYSDFNINTPEDNKLLVIRRKKNSEIINKSFFSSLMCCIYDPYRVYLF
jgi:hypothetical protein